MCCTQYVSKFGKLGSDHRTGKGQFSFQSQSKAVPRNAQTTTQLHSSHTLVKYCSKFSKPGFILQYVNRELPDLQAGFRKGRGTKDQIANIRWIIEKAREIQKHIYFCFIDCTKAFDCVDHNKLWKILKEMGILDHLTCPLKNRYAGQEATVRTGHGMADWFRSGKGVRQVYILSPWLFLLYAVYIMQNAGLEEAQAGIKIARRIISNLSYADDTTLMAESKELKSFLMKVEEKSEKADLKLNIQKAKIMTSGPITSWQIDGAIVERVRDFIMGGSKITADSDCSCDIKR